MHKRFFYRFYTALFLIALHLTVFIPQAFAIDLYALGSYWEVDDADGVWGAGLGASIPVFTDFLKLDGRVYLFENSEIGRREELELLPIDFGAQIHILPNSTFDPYILGGVSWVYADADRADVDNSFGAYIGGGLDFGMTDHIRPFGEIIYRMTELDVDRFSEDEIDVSGVTANLGLKVHF